jgi:hypothetical protein
MGSCAKRTLCYRFRAFFMPVPFRGALRTYLLLGAIKLCMVKFLLAEAISKWRYSCMDYNTYALSVLPVVWAYK